MRDDADEDQRDDHHDRPLRLVHRRRHEVGRQHLAAGVDREQQVARPVRVRLVGDARDDVRASERARRRVLREVLEDEEEREEDRELREERQARGGRVDVVLPVELHHLLVQLLAVALVLPLDLLHLRRVPLERLHRVDLPHRQRHEQDPHDDRGADDRPGPRQADVVVEPLEHPAHGVLERLEDAGDAEDEPRASRVVHPAAATTGCSGAAASPPSPSPSRARACAARRSRTASSTGGTCRCPPATSSAERPAAGVDERDAGLRRRRGRVDEPTASFGSSAPPSRAPRPRARRATRGREPRPPRAGPAARRGRSRSPAAIVVRVELRAPDLAQLALDPVADDRVAGGLRNCEPEPRLARLIRRARTSSSVRKRVETERPWR